MTNRLPTAQAWAISLLAPLALAGCVERRFVIITDPPGAIVTDERGQNLGPAPADKSFVHYGTYEFILRKDGYQTMSVREEIKAPWYEWPFLDFVSENLIPWTIRDVRRKEYVLQPLQIIPPENVLQQGQLLRERGRNVGIQLPGAPVFPADPLAAGDR